MIEKKETEEAWFKGQEIRLREIKDTMKHSNVRITGSLGGGRGEV